MFFDADPAMMAATEALRHRDPCGHLQSVVQTTLADEVEAILFRSPLPLSAASIPGLSARRIS